MHHLMSTHKYLVSLSHEVLTKITSEWNYSRPTRINIGSKYLFIS